MLSYILRSTFHKFTKNYTLFGGLIFSVCFPICCPLFSAFSSFVFVLFFRVIYATFARLSCLSATCLCIDSRATTQQQQQHSSSSNNNTAGAATTQQQQQQQQHSSGSTRSTTSAAAQLGWQLLNFLLFSFCNSQI